MWNRECVFVKSSGRTHIARFWRNAAYFARQRGWLSPALLVHVSFAPVDDLAVDPAGEQY